MQSFSTMRKHFRMEISSWYFSFTGNIFFFKEHLSRSFYLRYNLQNFLSFFERGATTSIIISPVIRQKVKSQNERFKKTKNVKFSEKQLFFTQW